LFLLEGWSRSPTASRFRRRFASTPSPTHAR
jgi:hypothetical protein